MKAIVTVVGKDQVGIIAGVCNTLAASRINVLDISQTIMEGYFTMMMVVDLTECQAPFDALRADLKGPRREPRPVHPHPAGGHLRCHAQAVRGGEYVESAKHFVHHQHDRQAAPGHPHHYHGHLPAGLRRRGYGGPLLRQDLRQDLLPRRKAGPDRLRYRERVRHPHRQQAHLRHAHRHRRRGLQKRGLRPPVP